jgi:hypothetical protein
MSATFGVGEILTNKASRTGGGTASRVKSLISDKKQIRQIRARQDQLSVSSKTKGPILQRGPVSTLHFLGHGS